MQNIPHSRPTFDAEFERAAAQVIQSQQLAQGEATTRLEKHISQALGLPHTLAVDSGTSALMLAIRGLTQGKTKPRVGIPSLACASLLFAVKAANAEPVFMDCSVDLTLDAEQAFAIANTLDILVLVHPFGMVEPLAAQTFPCPVIEDIAQSVGATLDGKPVGSFGDICMGSLYATKPWGAAYGGFIASHQHPLISTITSMVNPDAAHIHAEYVGHHQLSNIHAALASVRIRQADKTQQQRGQWAEKYDAVLSNLDATPIKSSAKSVGNDFRYIVRSEQHANIVIQQLRDRGIGASKPIQQPLHHTHSATLCPQASLAWQHCISLPLLADMADIEFHQIQQGMQACFHF
ncbi:MAG: DegT/DnrJ/EryC1/StrS family aminotransferase [Ghiorsea sp.]|nr:DegT/DnrJ/EryC1/StrS family aminotransferase [Ghiorsea sp.]